MHAEPLYVSRALEAGAAGYVSKNAAPDELLTRRPPGRRRRPLRRERDRPGPGARRPSAPAGVDQLTARELEIMRLLAAGASLAEIAEALGVALQDHRQHLHPDQGQARRRAAPPTWCGWRWSPAWSSFRPSPARAASCRPARGRSAPRMDEARGPARHQGAQHQRADQAGIAGHLHQDHRAGQRRLHHARRDRRPCPAPRRRAAVRKGMKRAKPAPSPAPAASAGAKMPPGAPDAEAARLATNLDGASEKPRPGWPLQQRGGLGIAGAIGEPARGDRRHRRDDAAAGGEQHRLGRAPAADPPGLRPDQREQRAREQRRRISPPTTPSTGAMNHAPPIRASPASSPK